MLLGERPRRRRPVFQLHARPAADSTLLDLCGELDCMTMPMLIDEVERIISRQVRPRVILDLSKVGFCDFSGLGALVSGMRRVRGAGGELVLSGVHGMAARGLQRTGLKKFFACYPTPASASAALDRDAVHPA